MGKIKWKARKTKLAKLDVNVPITIDVLGTINDPCFAKHYDGTNSDCRRSGDTEACLIGMSQNNTIIRTQLEAKQHFKDIKPEEFQTNLPQVHRFIEEKLKDKKSQECKVSVLAKGILEKICPPGSDIDDAKLAIKRIMKKSLTLEYSSIEGKKSIKLKHE